MTEVLSIGECMLELTRQSEALCRFAYGGDSLNTAVYLARLGVRVDYMTALGSDSLSDWLCDQWRAEGVGVGRVTRLDDRLPGLYLVETDASGERRFFYWRETSAARALLSALSRRDLADILSGYRLIYLTGITLALYPPADRSKLEAALADAKAAGVQIAFDPNFRLRIWAGRDDAAAAIDAAFALADFTLLADEDLRLLHGIDEEAAIFDHLAAARVPEIVLRKGDAGAVVRKGGETRRIPARKVADVVDTTAAGDSFNAAYLAARLAGRAPEAAAVEGCRLAAEVIRHPGAITPRPGRPLPPEET